MTPLLPVCVSLHVPVARIADMPPRIPMHATSKRIGSETFPPPPKKKKKIQKKYQKRKFDARTTPDTCRLFKTSQKMVRRVPTPVRPQRSRKLRLTRTPARRLDAAARCREVLSLATLHNSPLSKLLARFDPFTTLESSSYYYYYSLFRLFDDSIYLDSREKTLDRRKELKIRFRSLEGRKKIIVHDRSIARIILF